MAQLTLDREEVEQYAEEGHLEVSVQTTHPEQDDQARDFVVSVPEGCILGVIDKENDERTVIADER